MRMEDDRTTKAVVLGWMEDLEGRDKVPGRKRKTIYYWKRILKEAGIDWTQIGQLTQDRKIWKSIVNERMKYLEPWKRRKGKRTPGIADRETWTTDKMRTYSAIMMDVTQSARVKLD